MGTLSTEQLQLIEEKMCRGCGHTMVLLAKIERDNKVITIYRCSQCKWQVTREHSKHG